jgi:hypothetical protein
LCDIIIKMSCKIDIVEGRIGDDIQISVRYFDVDLNDGIDLTNLSLKMGIKKSNEDTVYIVNPTSIIITKEKVGLHFSFLTQ